MAMLGKSSGLEIDEDLNFQRRSWRVQRAAWSAMVIIVVAACAGLFGRGPLSHASAGEPGSLVIEYERLVRLAAPTQVDLHIAATSMGADSSVAIWIDREWLAKYDIRQITPEPSRSGSNHGGIEYHFRIDPADAHVTIALDTRAMGVIRGRIGIAGRPVHAISQFSYP